MLAAAKRNVLVELGAIVIERGRTGESAFIAIGAGRTQEDLGALLDDDTPQLDVFARDAMGRLDRRQRPQNLLDKPRELLGMRSQGRLKLWILRQMCQARVDCVGGSFMTAHHELLDYVAHLPLG